MNQLEEYLIKNSYKDPQKPLNRCDFNEVFRKISPRYFGEGFNTRVFITKDNNWVIKEGRWDLNLDMFSYGGFKFPPMIAKILMRIFKRNFVPREDVVISQYADYLVFYKYLGFSPIHNGDESPYHDFQIKLRDSLFVKINKIRRKYALSISDELISKLESIKYENLLPKEYLLYSESISRENEFENTYFIVQEYVYGKPFHDSNIKELQHLVLLKLLLIAVLILIMYDETKMVPDMRPRYIINEPMNWFSRTDNIIISDDVVSFVDTRLLWNSKRGPIKRGLIIPEMTIKSCRSFINQSSKILLNKEPIKNISYF